MRRQRYTEYYSRNIIVIRKPYGFFSFLFDCIMTIATGGFWLFWVIFRELRNG